MFKFFIILVHSGPIWSQTKKHLIRKVGQFRFSCAYAQGQCEEEVEICVQIYLYDMPQVMFCNALPLIATLDLIPLY